LLAHASPDAIATALRTALGQDTTP
jgi:hypothetical protein